MLKVLVLTFILTMSCLVVNSTGQTPNHIHREDNREIINQIKEVDNRLTAYANTDSELAFKVVEDVAGIRSTLESTNQLVFWLFTSLGIAALLGGIRFILKGKISND